MCAVDANLHVIIFCWHIKSSESLIRFDPRLRFGESLPQVARIFFIVQENKSIIYLYLEVPTGDQINVCVYLHMS